MLYECAAHGTRVSSELVLYSGWKSYGRFLQTEPLGSYWTCPKPFAALAVMKPAWPVVRSFRSIRRPCAVSFMVTTMRSPEFMNRSVAPFGVKVPTVELTGLGGACGTPLLVMNAKLTGSMLARFWHDLFSCVPWKKSSSKLSMFRAAHQRFASQLTPAGQLVQPGG